MIKAWFFVGTVLLVAPCEAATDMTGADLLRLCSAQPRTEEHKACSIYVRGMVEGMAAEQHLESRGRATCFGNNSMSHQRQVVEEYLRRHPANLQLEGAALAAYALSSDSPCSDTR